jgi:hypothetical protein
MCCSPCSRVATLSLNPNGGTGWPRKTTAGTTTLSVGDGRWEKPICRPAMATRWFDGRGPLADLCQPPRPTTLSVGDGYVDVSRAKLSQSSLLHKVGWYRDQHPDPGCPCSWGRSEYWLQPDPFKGRGRPPLGESARAHFHVLVSISASQSIRILMQDIGCAHNTLRGSLYLRVQLDRRPTVPTMNNYGNRGNDVSRAMRSLCVRRSWALRCCCMILWPQPSGTSCICPGLV